MGGHPFFYVVPYDPDLQAVLEKLRQRVFSAGRYNPATMFPEFPVTAQSPSPGPAHASIEEARDAADADGTRSILDITAISNEPEFFCASPLPDEFLESLFGTTQPTRAAVEANLDLFESIERGQAAYI